MFAVRAASPLLPPVAYDDFDIFALPANGPHYITTAGFDRVILPVLARAKDAKWLCAGSAGALRTMCIMRALATGDDSCSEILANKFCDMTYTPHSTPSDLARMMDSMLSAILPPSSATLHTMLEHATCHVAIFVCRLPLSLAFLPRPLLRAGVAAALAAGAQRRMCFHTGSERPLFGDAEYVRLTADNVRDVLRATTCIPSLTAPCTFVRGVGQGYFCDAGVTDYDLSFIPPPSMRALCVTDEPNLYGTFVRCVLGLPLSPLPPNVAVLHTVEDAFPLPLTRLTDWFEEVYIKRPAARQKVWKAAWHASIDSFPTTIPLPPPPPPPLPHRPPNAR